MERMSTRTFSWCRPFKMLQKPFLAMLFSPHFLIGLGSQVVKLPSLPWHLQETQALVYLWVQPFSQTYLPYRRSVTLFLTLFLWTPTPFLSLPLPNLYPATRAYTLLIHPSIAGQHQMVSKRLAWSLVWLWAWAFLSQFLLWLYSISNHVCSQRVKVGRWVLTHILTLAYSQGI